MQTGLRFVLLGFLLTSGTTGFAQEIVRMMPDYTFKRVAVPNADAQRRITVQIDPDAPRLEPVYASAPTMPADDADPAGIVASELGWFWEHISPRLDAARSDRLFDASQALANPPANGSAPRPRLQHLQEIVDQYGVAILRETIGTRVSPALVLAVIATESDGQLVAVSPAGAQGLMQLMPATAARFGVTDSFAPDQNIAGGVAYLQWLLEQYQDDPILALAGYNAGEGNVAKYEGVPPFAETRDYVPKVLAAWEVAKGLCMTPPELVTDACVFHFRDS